MYIEQRTSGDVVILDIHGKMVLGDGDVALKFLVFSLVGEGKKKIILNLAGCPYVDAAGNGEICRCYTHVSRQGGQLKLLNLTQRIADLLEITNLRTVYDIFDNETVAVASFR